MLYLFTGDDEFSIEAAVLRLKQEHQIGSLHFRRVAARLKGEADVDELIQYLLDALTFTIDGEPQLFWFEDLALTAGAPGLAKMQPYLEALADPDAPSMVVISASAIDGRLSLAKWLKANAESQHFDLVAPWEKEALIAQARAIAAKVGVKLSYSAASALVKRVGNSPRLTHQAAQLLALHAGEMTPDLIDGLVPMQTNDGIALARALLQRDVKAAMAELDRSMAQQEPPLRLIALLTQQVRQWIGIKAALAVQPRADNVTLAKMINLSGNPNRIYYLKQEVEAPTLEMLIRLTRLVTATENALKTNGGKANEIRAMRDLVLAVGRVVA